MEHSISTFNQQMITDISGLILNQCGWSKCDPNHTYGPAIRDHYLIHFISKGSGMFKKSDYSYQLNEGNCFLIYPHEETTYSASSNDPWEYYWVGFSGKATNSILKNTILSPTNPIFNLNENTDKIISCIKEMYAATHMSIGGTIKALGLLMQFLSYVLDSTQKTNEDTISPIQKKYLTQAIYYIQENYTKDINVKYLASHIGIDRSYLYRIFKEYYRISPSQYVILTRIDECCRLLRETTMPVGEIAMETGFSSSSHMGEEFKKRYGISPNQYRKKII